VPLTSAAVGLLLENGQLTLDEEIQVRVPQFPKKPWPVTLGHLMANVSGLRNDGGDEGPLYGERCERPVDALPMFAERDLRFEPGTRHAFSSYGWIVVSAAIEAAADTRLVPFMQTKIFAPLGMEHTRADSRTEPNPDTATSYFPRFAAEPRYGLHLMRPIDLSCYSGASVFLSTPSDLVRFGLAVNGGTLLQPATVQTLQRSQRLTSGAETGYGLGWEIEDVTLASQPAQWVGHNGTTLGGTVATLMTFRERGLVVAVLSNISYADTPAVALKIAQAFTEP
jgi:serine beta-lactamase-like protein LACTB